MSDDVNDAVSDDVNDGGAPTGARIVVTGGGGPDPTQLAALVVALTPAGADTPIPVTPAWRRAALLEGVGGASVLAPSDLDVAERARLR